MPVQDILILGIGPCGMSAAISLTRLSTNTPSFPLRITLIELRPTLQTIGGTVNLTPLAMRYLDDLGAGKRIRAHGIDLDNGLDYVSLRSGQRIGNIWGGIGSVRVARHTLVESLLLTLQEEHPEVSLRWGKRVTQIDERDDKVVLAFEDGEEMTGDMLLGCDGIHSSARRLWVDPERQQTFTGRVIAMGWGEGVEREHPMTLPNGEPALKDTAVFSSRQGYLLASYYEPSRTNVYFANIMFMKEPEGNKREGWRLKGNDQQAIQQHIAQTYRTGRIEGLQGAIAECQNWHLWPVYVLPNEGRWHRGKVLLMGDAAHAMPPQGESTGLAIEDGVLIAHVLTRRSSRTVEQMMVDFENLRKRVIAKYYEDAIWALNHGFVQTTWITSIFLEWGLWFYFLYKRWYQVDHFASDVRDLELPAEVDLESPK